ncbi:MAG: hypothetical protein ACK4OM_08035 [Alphaproteobacteria bacterium]
MLQNKVATSDSSNYFQDLVRPAEKVIKENKAIISQAINQIFESNKFNDKIDPRTQIFHELIELLKNKKIKLELSVYEAFNSEDAGGFGRYNIYNFKNEHYEFSLWMFAFAPGNKTVIHDHIVSCITTILSEQTLTEKLYKIASSEENKVERNPLKKERIKHSINEDIIDNKATINEEEIFIHSIKNMPNSKDTGVSMHMYFKAVEKPMNFSSLNRIFTKLNKTTTQSQTR